MTTLTFARKYLAELHPAIKATYVTVNASGAFDALAPVTVSLDFPCASLPPNLVRLCSREEARRFSLLASELAALGASFEVG